MKILVSGFEPFHHESMNPSMEVVKQLKNQIAGADIIKCILPVVYYESLAILKNKIKEEDPDVIISIGQAGGRTCISLEKVAINLNEARIADNANQQPHDESIVEQGNVAYFSNLPLNAILDTLKAHQIPVEISYSAGTYVCNHVFYGVRTFIDQEYPKKKSGFIHIPFIEEQVIDKGNVASMNLMRIVEGIELAIETIVKNEN